MSLTETPTSELSTVVRSQSLTDQAYAQLRRALLFGALKPGDKVTGRQVSQTLGVSLTPAREAIIRLAKEGALEVMPNRAYAVPVLSRSRYREIVKIRLSLEGMAAGEAAPRFDESAADALAARNEQLARLIGQGEFAQALQCDAEFHFAIYERAGMPVLVSMIDSLWLQIGPTRSLLTPGFQRTLEGYENHKRIIAALRDRNGAAARDAVVHDLDIGAKYLLGQLAD